ncbi:uncharacterized protein SCHCODRAFT_02608452 [Schizophyllum commune H4-8]|nr:uncharacterized protein SCHCODRAFT_02608452 [Schizophyllum commune H4-8]KAI5900640.1 hypothetical protein SCHCODRAFT_02608452 [Schizophyllum commune H4-8]
MSTTKANLDAVRTREDANKKVAPSTASSVATAPAPSELEASQASNSYAAWHGRPIATLHPYVPMSLDDIPLPPPDVVTPRDRHIIDLQIAKITKAWKDSRRNADEYLHEMNTWAAQVAEESKAAETKSL